MFTNKRKGIKKGVIRQKSTYDKQFKCPEKNVKTDDAF